MKITDITISSIESIAGSQPLILTAVKEDYKYLNGKRTNEQIGYIYTVVCTGRNYDRLSVKVPSSKAIISSKELESSTEAICVAFTGFEGKIYRNFQTNDYFLSCKAQEVTII